MITLRWSLFMVQEIEVESYNIYRSMVGFSFLKTAIGSGATLALEINNATTQTLTIPATNPVGYLNATLVGASAHHSHDDLSIIIRSDVMADPGRIKIKANSLGLAERLITQQSENTLIGIIAANNTEGAVETFIDQDGMHLDYYAVSSVATNAIESLKTPWKQPLPTVGTVCVVEGIVVNLQGVPMPDVDVIATLHETPRVRSLAFITKDSITTKTSPDGRFSIPLLQGALVKLEIPSIGYTQMVTTPCRSYIFLQELLVDKSYTYPLGYRE